MKRFGVVVGAALLAGVGALGLTGCGVPERATGTAQQAAVDVAAAMGADGQALAAMGFDTAQIAAADPAADPSVTGGADPSGGPGANPSAGPGKKGQRAQDWRKRHQARVLLRRNTLHGEVVVQTKDGTKTVAVQRGTVTAISDTSMTVKSTDGFTETWTFGPQLKVVERRSTIQPSAVKVGTELGVAGAKDGDKGVARLIVIPNKK
ncbi:hypothetical protein ACFFWC_02995 [Plantactinospora siamensis]|uniref:DUF5666 domain-containing protein n=1 Tax=Plantactinospora siamensis TaxID=555372 RepID=A0ABV6NRV1_9ACTN